MVDVLGIKPEESGRKGNCLLKRRSIWHDHGHEGRESQVQGHRLHQMSTSILCTVHFCEHFRKRLRSQKVDYQQLDFSYKDSSSTRESIRLFYVVEKEKLTGLGSKPRLNELQCKPRVGTEGM